MGVTQIVTGRPPSVTIWPGSPEALGNAGGDWQAILAGGGTSAVWPTASLSIGYPFSVAKPCTAVKLWVMNGGAVSGNIDLGIYDASGNLLVSKGSTAQSGTTAIQVLDTTDYVLSPTTLYYMFLAIDNITATTRCITTQATALRLESAGVVQVAANFPLATGKTFAIPSNAYLPLFGLSRMATF